MSTLVHAALRVRRTARGSFAFVAAGVLLCAVLVGAFEGPPAQLGFEHAIVAAAWAALLCQRLLLHRGRFVDLEVGALVLVGAHAVVQLAGGLAGPAYPLLYVVVAALAAFSRTARGTFLVLAAVALEALVAWVLEPTFDAARLALHGAYLGIFGALHVAITRVEVARVRARSRRELEGERERVREDARLFRLVGSSTKPSEAPTEEKVYRSSLDQVREGLYHLLELLRRTLRLHTCILLLREGEGLRVVELATDSDDIGEGPFPLGAGAVGAVASRGLVMNLEHLRPGYGGLCYYRGPAPVRAFLGVPVTEGEQVLGALCADRREERPFGPEEEEILRQAVRQTLRLLENERVFVQLERSKREQEHLYEASRALGEALTEEQVIDAAMGAARALANFDFAAITSLAEGRHEVRTAVGDGADAVQRLTFRDNHVSLVAMAVRNRHYLPYRGDFDPAQQVVFTRRVRLPPMRSLLIVPLLVREDAIGTLVLAAKRPDAFPTGVRTTLEVLANQLAVALANADAVRRLEAMATTDGLTGCLNKRAFLEALDAKLKAAERFDQPLSLLVTDLDHFKSVNDTYGHATGDVVIKELGALLRRVKRETDVVARFGGEEFCVLCEQTDRKGAVQLAERIREEMAGTVMQTELGKLTVTCSIGVATFPADAKTPSALFEITDQALYAAKRAGRNRVCTSRDV